MSDWKPVALGCLCVLGGILLTHLLFLYSQFNADSQGYMWRAARKLWGFVLPFFLVEWVAGCFFFLPIYFIPVNYLSGYLPADYLSGYRMHLIIAVIAAVIGFLVAFAPTALELHSLPEEGVTVASLQKPLTRMVLKLNLVLRHQFAWAIETRRQQDLYDCQYGDGLSLGLEWRYIRRGIRMFYEVCKRDIAMARGDSTLLFFDVDHSSQEKFYLLVRHVGRRRLRRYLKNPKSPSPTWKGDERRRVPGYEGSKAHRADLTSNASSCRVYDDKNLLALIDSRRPPAAL